MEQATGMAMQIKILFAFTGEPQNLINQIHREAYNQIFIFLFTNGWSGGGGGGGGSLIAVRA